MSLFRSLTRQLALLNVHAGRGANAPAQIAAAQTPTEEVVATNPFASPLGCVRGKKKKGGGNTRNKCGFPKGKKKGVKVYDGQRVVAGMTLALQPRLNILPGWNVKIWGCNNLQAMCHGRVMITTEKADVDFDRMDGLDDESRKFHFGRAFPEQARKAKHLFRMHMHIVPDEPHQYFKLVEQV